MFEALATYMGMGWIYYVLVVIYALTVVAIVIVIISENRNPVKSLAWVTVLLLLPFVGIVLYVFFGRNIKNKRMISRRNRRRLKKRELRHPRNILPEGFSEESRQKIRLGRSLTGAPFHPGNDINIFISGADKMAAFKDDLRNAQRSICMQYYIFCDDNVGTEIRDILVDRARAGVEVRVIYDHVGSWGTSSRFFKSLQEAGVKVYPFFKVTFPQLGTKINWRNHRKICIIDGAVGYIGGINIADRYMDGGSRFDKWRDTHARVKGPIIASLLHSFAVDWNFMGQPLIDDIADPAETYDKGDVGMQLLTSGPTSQWSDIEFIFQKAISSAKKRVYIQTPYISECLRAGIKFYQYTAGMLHSKTILVDDEFSTIGSSNFDFRSFEHNFEANLFIYSHRVNERMADIFRTDIHDCRRIMPAEWRSRPLMRKAMQSLLRLLSPIL